CLAPPTGASGRLSVRLRVIPTGRVSVFPEPMVGAAQIEAAVDLTRADVITIPRVMTGILPRPSLAALLLGGFVTARGGSAQQTEPAPGPAAPAATASEPTPAPQPGPIDARGTDAPQGDTQTAAVQPGAQPKEGQPPPAAADTARAQELLAQGRAVIEQ